MLTLPETVAPAAGTLIFTVGADVSEMVTGFANVTLMLASKRFRRLRCQHGFGLAGATTFETVNSGGSTSPTNTGTVTWGFGTVTGGVDVISTACPYTHGGGLIGLACLRRRRTLA